MQKTILISGSTDGIGLETAKMLTSKGYRVLLHGRNSKKVADLARDLSLESYVADLSKISEVRKLGQTLIDQNVSLDVLINNAGVLNAADPVTPDGLDVRFAVNTIAPYLLTKLILPLFEENGRVINLSSAAQSPVSLLALQGKQLLPDDMEAYAQSKLALTMWSRSLALSLADKRFGDSMGVLSGPAVIAVNPGSLLGSKMVKDGFGVAGGDLRIGADILTRAALSEEFNNATGKYFDNDAKQFTVPHPHVQSLEKCNEVVDTIEAILSKAN